MTNEIISTFYFFFVLKKIVAESNQNIKHMIMYIGHNWNNFQHDKMKLLVFELCKIFSTRLIDGMAGWKILTFRKNIIMMVEFK